MKVQMRVVFGEYLSGAWLRHRAWGDGAEAGFGKFLIESSKRRTAPTDEREIISENEQVPPQRKTVKHKGSNLIPKY